MKKPGIANPYDNQPMNFSDYHPSPNDEMHDQGSVHTFSSFGNYAFYLSANKISASTVGLRLGIGSLSCF
jgi:Zn-dependent metalloprotease